MQAGIVDSDHGSDSDVQSRFLLDFVLSIPGGIEAYIGISAWKCPQPLLPLYQEHLVLRAEHYGGNCDLGGSILLAAYCTCGSSETNG